MWAEGQQEPSPKSTLQVPGVPPLGSPPDPADLGLRSRNSLSYPALQRSRFCLQPQATIVSNVKSGQTRRTFQMEQLGAPWAPGRIVGAPLAHPLLGVRITGTLVAKAARPSQSAATASSFSPAYPTPAATWLQLCLTAPANCHTLH